MATLLSPLFAGGGYGLGPPHKGPKPVLEYNGDVFYLDTPAVIDWWCDYIRYWSITTIGFDTEWKPDFQSGENHPIALIQLCFRKSFWGYGYSHDSNYICLLIHVSLSGMTAKLKALLEDEAVTKSGVVLDRDIQKLSKHYAVELKGYSDVDTHVQYRIYNAQGPSLGMTKLVDMVLGMDLKKSKSVSISNWESSHLSLSQQKYAATDAYTCLRLYEALAWQPLVIPCLPACQQFHGYICHG